MISHGDCILAGCGFLIEEKLTARRAVLIIPAFTPEKNQLTARDVDLSPEIAHVRIHVERVIGQLNKFKILESVLSCSHFLYVYLI